MTVPTDHAVVIGASMGGLLAARALSDTYRQVTVLERDVLPTEPVARRGVPQGRHAHGLLARGREALEELFPGFTDDLEGRGGESGDLQDGARWYSGDRRMRRAPSGMLGITASRPLIEATVRDAVRRIPNVRVRDGVQVTGPTSSADRRSVTGVLLLNEARLAERIDADLVVDASGRGSRGGDWLEDLGYEPPTEDRVEIDLVYATRTYRRGPERLDGDIVVVGGATPEHPRAGVLVAIEDDRWILTLAGMLGDHPPTDEPGFNDFLESLPTRDLVAAVRSSEPLDDPRRFRYPASVRRRYERLRRFPKGYLAFGDAICSFNPVYGQGMTVAALEALALRDCLDRGTRSLARRFFRRAAKIVDIPWDVAAGSDLRFEGVAGPRTAKVRLANAWVERVHAAAPHDAEVTRAFLRVANLMDRPEALFRPGVVRRVLAAGRRATPTVAARDTALATTGERG